MQIKVNQIQHHREILRKRQKDICPLCHCELSKNLPSLDHDHGTGAIRDVLCRNCNQVEGRINTWAHRGKRGMPKDKYLKNLLAYWSRHEENQTGLIHPSHGKVVRRRRKSARVPKTVLRKATKPKE